MSADVYAIDHGEARGVEAEETGHRGMDEAPAAPAGPAATDQAFHAV